ncbi:Iron-binding zinc finger CDGSH type [Saccharopolyspora antimicrobica]|uniref:Iron-binding CDGSH zinc finger protein n=1 Tax=Saccharopolyspora antimicrobica TaxID=455193 RepID=A0A1I5KRV3_9PSEU|nr:CDGSH iron-sulfur domain-containing protein [Saccharopolyspora antimicrobica]RKT89146.1 iron-binding CDGSH zinc finger protein [Saccharopolyspora antimicrobica]SFO87745.1 Iron-binding zinc finger CDGSH type [Saccharopolyspora antimicrobica]
MPDRSPARVEITGEGPVLIHGPVELVMPDGVRIRSERAVTALCTCRRSRRYPMCDTSHRRCARNRRKESE